MSTHSPVCALRRETSLSGSKRLNRWCIVPTHAAPQLSCPASNPTPSRWQELPSASNLASSIGQETYVEVTVWTSDVRTAGDSFSEPPEGLETAGGAPSTAGWRGAAAFFTWPPTCAAAAAAATRVSAVAAAFSSSECTAARQNDPTGFLMKPSLSYAAPRISLGSAPR